jgi:hypothetical protein
MNVDTFKTYLVAASYWATKGMSDKLGRQLPFNFNYAVALNQSCDVDALPQFTVFPEDDNKFYERLTIQEVAELLSRDGKNPAWIDIYVDKCDDRYTTLRLVCSGRYTQSFDNMYYAQNGLGPFGVKLTHTIMEANNQPWWKFWQTL